LREVEAAGAVSEATVLGYVVGVERKVTGELRGNLPVSCHGTHQ